MSVPQTAALLDAAIDAYADDPAAVAALRAASRRLAEPLRVALAGMVKAGKSTLLNAIIGEEVAPTGTGECTRVVTWYRHGASPALTLHARDGTAHPMPVRRVDGRLVLPLGERTPAEVDRIVVHWPSAALRATTLIDTPGIASLSEDVSARTRAFLTPPDAPSEADAVVYLMRHVHAADLGFLEAFADDAVGRTVNALAVLSRADEVGAGRIDALISAAAVAERYAADEHLSRLALAVVPVAGLLAQGARTLRQHEYAALRELVRLERRDRERLLLSADRFVRADALPGVDAATRAALVERLGVFGIRMAVASLRGGADGPTALTRELVRRSGLETLLTTIAGQFQARADVLKARSAVVALERVLRERPRPGTEDLRAGLERLEAGAHELAELRLLATLRGPAAGMDRTLAREAERLLGGRGMAAHERLDLPASATPEELRAAAVAAVARWRARAESPLTDRATATRCRLVVRSCEALAAAQVRPPAQASSRGASPSAQAVVASSS